MQFLTRPGAALLCAVACPRGPRDAGPCPAAARVHRCRRHHRRRHRVRPPAPSGARTAPVHQRGGGPRPEAEPGHPDRAAESRSCRTTRSRRRWRTTRRSLAAGVNYNNQQQPPSSFLSGSDTTGHQQQLRRQRTGREVLPVGHQRRRGLGQLALDDQQQLQQLQPAVERQRRRAGHPAVPAQLQVRHRARAGVCRAQEPRDRRRRPAAECGARPPPGEELASGTTCSRWTRWSSRSSRSTSRRSRCATRSRASRSARWRRSTLFRPNRRSRAARRPSSRREASIGQTEDSCARSSSTRIRRTSGRCV